ncbi:unnamed protein product [Musa textilis]
MELEENNHACKRSWAAGSGGQAAKIGRTEHQDEDEEDGERKGGGGADTSRRGPWQQHLSSRIFRVSRASGGKDRHSKVYTAKGLRDRRIRLSVSTAIQFYDLQDRLGYDQPSKAIEWLIKAASAAINELPPLECFPKPPHSCGDETTNADRDVEPSYDQQQQQQHPSNKSGCSSSSDTSKGSVSSLSRPEGSVKARERARGREAKNKEDRDDSGCIVVTHHRNLNPILNPQTSSFTELLTGSSNRAIPVAAGDGNSSHNCIQKQVSTADYFGQDCLFAQSQRSHPLPSGFSSQSHFGNSSPMGMLSFNIAAAGDHQEMQQFSSLQDHLFPVATTGDYNHKLHFVGSCRLQQGDPSVQFTSSFASAAPRQSQPPTEALFYRRRIKPAILLRFGCSRRQRREPTCGRVRRPPAALLRGWLSAFRPEGQGEELKRSTRWWLFVRTPLLGGACKPSLISTCNTLLFSLMTPVSTIHFYSNLLLGGGRNLEVKCHLSYALLVDMEIIQNCHSVKFVHLQRRCSINTLCF